MPPLPDVQWDFNTAEATVQALRQVAEKLDASNYERAVLARETVLEWRGPQRLEFDDRLEQILSRAAQLAHTFRDLASHINAVTQRCYEEQKQRERLRSQ